MRTKKMKITVLEVKSFVTELDRSSVETVNGGATADYTIEHTTNSSVPALLCEGPLITRVNCDVK